MITDAMRQEPTFALDSAGAEHAAAVARAIAEDIANAGGRISFERFMELALFAPGLGYYSAGAGKLGPGGDFVTAPEISSLFGRCIGRFAASAAGAWNGRVVLEIGAGTGALAASMLPELARLGALPQAYCILEVSPDLRARQRQRLEPLARALGILVSWIDDLPGDGFNGLVIANEVLDAIPVRRFRLDHGVVREWFVSCHGEGFTWEVGPPADAVLETEWGALKDSLEHPLPDGYSSECSPARRAWVSTVVEALGDGLVLLIDYGYARHEYYHPQRVDGSLACHFRHRRNDDPLSLPGLQDISAHVDFSAVAESTMQAGGVVAGFTTQAHFLLANGLLDLCAELAPGSQEFMRAAGEVQRLTMPGQMGETVRVMALTKLLRVASLPGFSSVDLRDRLSPARSTNV